jgi:hypothetical protein
LSQRVSAAIVSTGRIPASGTPAPRSETIYSHSIVAGGFEEMS